jgi:hypothetical protein
VVHITKIVCEILYFRLKLSGVSDLIRLLNKGYSKESEVIKMITATVCEWCELDAPTQTVVVKGFEHATHQVCVDCTMATELVECATCDNVATFMQDTIYFVPRYVGMCLDCDEV